jgi:hypothetical protein
LIEKPMATNEVALAVNAYNRFGHRPVSEPTKSKNNAPAKRARTGEVAIHSMLGPENTEMSFTLLALQHAQ